MGSVEIRATTRTSPVGVCIYCGSGDNLTDEHVLPFGLGGNLVLPKASRKRYAAITPAFEGRVQRGLGRREIIDVSLRGSSSQRRESRYDATRTFSVKFN
jgi:hypothetical protein